MSLEKLFRLSEAKLEATNGQLAKAAAIISATLDSSPNDPDAREALAEIVGAHGRKDLEVGILAELLQEQPSSWRIADSLIKALVSDGRESEVQDFLVGFVVANPDVPEAIIACDSLGIDINKALAIDAV